jgi:hypothetical protein
MDITPAWPVVITWLRAVDRSGSHLALSRKSPTKVEGLRIASNYEVMLGCDTSLHYFSAPAPLSNRSIWKMPR